MHHRRSLIPRCVVEAIDLPHGPQQSAGDGAPQGTPRWRGDETSGELGHAVTAVEGRVEWMDEGGRGGAAGWLELDVCFGLNGVGVGVGSVRSDAP
jgi:hypothetical protein